MKKLLIALVSAVCLVFATPTSAATWTHIGSDYVVFTKTGWGKNFYQGGVNKSKGGQIRIAVPYAKPLSEPCCAPVMEIQVWEDDGNDKLDDKITTLYHSAPRLPSGGSRFYHVDVSKYVDGVNKRAEIYLKYGGNYRTSVKVSTYD